MSHYTPLSSYHTNRLRSDGRMKQNLLFVHKYSACARLFHFICLSFLCSISSEWIDFIAFALYTHRTMNRHIKCARPLATSLLIFGTKKNTIYEFYPPTETKNCLEPVHDFIGSVKRLCVLERFMASVHMASTRKSTLLSINVPDWFSNGLFACSSRSGHPTTLCDAIVSPLQCHLKWHHAVRYQNYNVKSRPNDSSQCAIPTIVPFSSN